MATANDVLRIASGEVGYYRHDDPLTGTKYGRWYAELTGSSYFGTNGVPYCAMFVSYVFAMAGQSMPGLPTASCSVIMANNRGTSRQVTKTSAKPGDIVLFDWGGDGAPDHVGIVELNNGSYIQTIEGNTSLGTAGSQGNGGYVARRTRAWSTVYAVYRPNYGEDEVTDADITKIAQSVWNYGVGSEGKSGYNNAPAWQHLSFAHYDTARLYQGMIDTSDPTGRDVKMNDHDHIKWLAAGQAAQNEVLAKAQESIDKLLDAVADMSAALQQMAEGAKTDK